MTDEVGQRMEQLKLRLANQTNGGAPGRQPQGRSPIYDYNHARQSPAQQQPQQQHAPPRPQQPQHQYVAPQQYQQPPSHQQHYRHPPPTHQQQQYHQAPPNHQHAPPHHRQAPPTHQQQYHQTPPTHQQYYQQEPPSQAHHEYQQPPSHQPAHSRQPPPAPHATSRHARPNATAPPPTVQDLQHRLRAQRQQLEAGSGRDSHRHGQMQQQLQPYPQQPQQQQPYAEPAFAPPQRHKVPSSYASSTTSSSFSEYSEPSTVGGRQSYRHDERKRRASLTNTDISEECDEEFDVRMMPPRRRNEYDFNWEGGSLGLVLVEDPANRMPIVKRVSSNVSAAARVVKEGDTLLYINANATREFKMPALMGMLKDLKKPLIMRFKRAGTDAEAVKSGPVLPPVLEGEYEFYWEEGSLGMTMGVTSAELPYVKRLTGRGHSPHLKLVHPGDELIMINDRVCADLGFEKAMEVIKSVPKPATLRFRLARADATYDDTVSQRSSVAPPALTLDEASMYAVTWSDGPFGLTVKELTTDKGPVPVVTRKTGRSTCAGLRRVAVGDVLVEIGSMKAVDLGFDNTTKVLRNIAKPVMLRFQAVAE
ncbi:hypothetical protein SDRG_10793 [Saprolegnia diclina VS20]|uniref:PDZ domain-containing protein n=1 Tax=Saprolegnia diclina (strain VS20) TaxID=1156394 RepID=T0RNL7_SAPDV|nr:hypothetical protein SDRG_10793 [Saprolegnia diclina VS20]EQC31627.1 hypothetical protein SDRG_10793 [Saprolegnia diclina VS20]|eukprot:XP_008615026.1 hypothetical protein SDRG_10793 [Saprolegnia diclina VS20]